MTCEEFRKNLVELCDKDVNPDLRTRMEHHRAHCDECRTEYNEYMAVVDLLRPQNTHTTANPDQTDTLHNDCHIPNHPHRRTLTHRRQRWLHAAAAILLFAAGVCTGWSRFFSTEATANELPSQTLSQAIAGLRNVGNFVADFQVRTTGGENFAYLNPNADFVHLHLAVFRENGTICWRMEKENGRTVVCDGQNQFMWYGEHYRVTDNADANFLEGFAPLLQPENMLESLEEILKDESETSFRFTETDSTLVLTATVPRWLGFFVDQPSGEKMPCALEYVFDKANGLPQQLRIWAQQGDKQVLVLESKYIRYNVALDRKTLTTVPKGQTEWTVTDPPLIRENVRLSRLQKETAIEAARRITEALASGDTLNAREALHPYRQVLPQLMKTMSGCKMSDFRENTTTKNYAGTHVTFTETLPDGTARQRTIFLRRDNTQRIWILDGGF